MRTPQGKNWKSDRRSCWEGSKERVELAKRWLFLSIPKKETKHIAQKEASKLERRLSLVYIR